MMSEILHNEIFNKSIFNQHCLLQFIIFRTGIPYGLPPVCGHALESWLSSGSGAVAVLILLIW